MDSTAKSVCWKHFFSHENSSGWKWIFFWRKSKNIFCNKFCRESEQSSDIWVNMAKRMLLDGLYELLNRRYPSLSVLLCLLSQQRDNKFPSPYTHHTPPTTPHTPPQLYNTHNRCPSPLIAPALSVASKLLARRGRIGSNPWKFRQDFKTGKISSVFDVFPVSLNLYVLTPGK